MWVVVCVVFGCDGCEGCGAFGPVFRVDDSEVAFAEIGVGVIAGERWDFGAAVDVAADDGAVAGSGRVVFDGHGQACHVAVIAGFEAGVAFHSVPSEVRSGIGEGVYDVDFFAVALPYIADP